MKPMFIVSEGEFLVGDHILRNLARRYEVWVPAKDVGVDLLVTRRKGRRPPTRLQVKFSRAFDFDPVPPSQFVTRGWFKLDPLKLRKSSADLWVFVILTPHHEKHFVLVPLRDLRRRIPRGAKVWNLYLVVLRGERCYDLRDLRRVDVERAVLRRKCAPRRDYSAYLNNFRLLGG